jgi:lysine 2,3-aminomutase
MSTKDFKFQVTKHIEGLAKKSPAVYNQFYPSEAEEINPPCMYEDPLIEEKYTVTKGLVHKYGNRVLCLLTLTCGAYCRFCTRKRKVSDALGGLLTDEDLQNIENYLVAHPNVNEIIFSGGDPFTNPIVLKKALKKFGALPQIKVIRIGTRMPIVSPQAIDLTIGDAIREMKQPVYLLMNFEHPDEITEETRSVCEHFRKSGAMLLSQSIFLKGINDNYDTLFKLFSGLIEIGVKPYYIFRCDPVEGAFHFMTDFEKEIEIMTKLRTNLSGMACPMYVIDVPQGVGKIPVPLNYWNFDKNTYRDFHGIEQKLVEFATHDVKNEKVRERAKR